RPSAVLVLSQHRSGECLITPVRVAQWRAVGDRTMLRGNENGVGDGPLCSPQMPGLAPSHAHVYVGPFLSLASPDAVGKKKHQRLRSHRSGGSWRWSCPSKSSMRMRCYGTWQACNSVSTGPISHTGKGACTRYFVK